ncbi:MAG: copper amine oxidase N-terminal domain-containing protein, partial [Tissierellia bacterium]|nr:copper amine oxidase N-terminal domain-containing protein [Tissierellia bacterium]
MNGRSNVLNRSLFFVLVLVLIFAQWPSSHSLATMSIKLIMDGKDITSLSSPIIENGRTLVPIRFIAEELEAEVIWNEKDRTVAIEKDGTSVLLRIDSHLITYENGDKSYGLSDVSPKIIDSRTYVPLRLVSNALGIGIEWDEANKFVSIDSSNKSDITPFFDLEILNLKPGQAITGKTNLQIELGNTNIKNAKDIKYLLLDPETAQGTVVARGNQLTNKYSWLPNLQDKGEKVLVAALYDDSGKFLAGDAIPVYIDINPKVSLTGVKESEILDDTIYLGADTNFVASYVEYEITKLDTDEINLITEQDPQGQYKWEPKIGENGDYSFKVRAYDAEGKSY